MYIEKVAPAIGDYNSGNMDLYVQQQENNYIKLSLAQFNSVQLLTVKF